MILITLIIIIFLTIVFLKTQKIKELNKKLILKETTFILLYEQRFEAFLKIINLIPTNIQNSLYMDIAELKKDSIFVKKYDNNAKYFALEEKLQVILNKLQQSEKFSKLENQEYFMQLNQSLLNINNLVEENKIQYNNLVDDFHQETTDFFGKQISSKMKKLKMYTHI